jgi:hypothetical protein
MKGADQFKIKSSKLKNRETEGKDRVLAVEKLVPRAFGNETLTAPLSLSLPAQGFAGREGQKALRGFRGTKNAIVIRSDLPAS